MGRVRALVRLPHESAIEADVAINTFHFDTATPPTTANLDAIESSLAAFYNADQSTARSVGSYLNPNIDRAADACTITYYDLGDPEPRQPIRTDTFTLDAAPNASTLPEEVALCLSYRHGPPYVGGTAPARQRGRIYVGSLHLSALDSNTGRPHDDFISTVAQAGADLIADAGTTWLVYSRVGDDYYVVNSIWVDNAWDTQRRRGLDATTRTVLP